MMLKVWHLIATATLEVRLLLDRALAGDGRRPDAPGSAAGPEVIRKLREALLEKLAELRSSLRALLAEKEMGLVLMPLVIHFDELVMRRLSLAEQAHWPLLQQELFDITYGGEVFFELATERMARADTPPVVFEVLLFCLNDGFSGQFSADPVRLERFRRQLIEKIPLPELPARGEKRRRERDPERVPSVPPLNPRWLYLLAFLGMVLMFGLTALLTNL